MNLTLGQRVLYEGTVLSRQFVIPQWFSGKSWATVTYVGELYTGFEIHNAKRFFESKFASDPEFKTKINEMGLKEFWVIGLTPEQIKIAIKS